MKRGTYENPHRIKDGDVVKVGEWFAVEANGRRDVVVILDKDGRVMIRRRPDEA